jgi:hypothetical protein
VYQRVSASETADWTAARSRTSAKDERTPIFHVGAPVGLSDEVGEVGLRCEPVGHGWIVGDGVGRDD